MDDIRKGEIALAYLKNELRKEGVRFTPIFWQQVRNAAKEIDVSTEEAMGFMEDIVRELVEEAFAPNHRG